MIGKFLVLTLLYSSHAFEMVCPSTEQWYLRALIKCSSLDQYTCLSDFSDPIYNESCSGPIVALPGERTVNSNKNFDIKPCTVERYQPFTFSSTQGSACLFQKGKCSEEGLLLYNNGTSEMDRTCRCDYTRGFAFSSTDRTDSCSCIAATEDCSCYKKECNESQVLSPDYKCINETHQQDTFVCSFIISSKESVINITDVVMVNVSILPNTQVYRNVTMVTATCCTIMLVFMIVSILLVSYWKLHEKFIIIKHLKDQHCFEGDSVTFTCEVNEVDIPGIWNKNGLPLKPSEYLTKTVDGKIHKLVLNSVTAKDSGNYSCQIKDKNSSSQLTVNEVIIIKHLEDQHNIEGDSVIFTCEINKKNLPGKWRKDGMELKETKSLSITVNERIHKLEIDSLTVDDRGYYSFKVKDKASSGHLRIMLIGEKNFIGLCHLLKTVAEPVVRKIFDREIHPDKLEKTLNQGKNKKIIDRLKKKKQINWREYDLLYPRLVEYSTKFKIKNYDYKTIHQNEEEEKKLRSEIQNAVSDICYGVQGTHKVEVVELEPGSLVAVLKLTASQFAEKKLMGTIKSAVVNQGIGSFETDMSGFQFKKRGNVPVSLSSKDFDIRLMMILMKNLIDIDIPDVLPFEGDFTEVADLSRIKYIRNKIVQNSDNSISDDDFQEDWRLLSEAVVRLGGNTLENFCKDLKTFKPTSQQCQDYLNPDNLQCDQPGSASTESLTDEYMKEACMHNLAREVVRRKFDKQFPPQTLKKELEKQKYLLKRLKEQRGITKSQWEDLFPVDKGSLSSTRFDIKVMIILLSTSSFKDKEIFKTIENLQNYLSRPKDEKKAIMQAINELSEKE